MPYMVEDVSNADMVVFKEIAAYLVSSLDLSERDYFNYDDNDIKSTRSTDMTIYQDNNYRVQFGIYAGLLSIDFISMLMVDGNDQVSNLFKEKLDYSNPDFSVVVLERKVLDVIEGVIRRRAGHSD